MFISKSFLYHSIHFIYIHHETFFIDEEIGSELGMNCFVQHEEFRKLNVGFAIDEGYSSSSYV